MPRGEPRELVAFRLSPTGKGWLDELSATHNVDRTEVFRAVMAVAKTHEKELTLLIKERKAQT